MNVNMNMYGPKKRKIIQIANGPAGVIALDNHGDVWRVVWQDDGWEKLPGLPEDDDDN